MRQVGTSKIYYNPKQLELGCSTTLVYKGYFASPKTKAAVKVILLRNHEVIKEDFAIWQKIKGGVNIIKYYGYFDIKNNGAPMRYVAMEVATSTLKRQVKELRLSTHDIQGYLRDAAKGIEWLHSKNIIHRNIKPDNILIMQNGRANLSEFGLVKVINPDGDQFDSLGRGVFDWMAPEAITSCVDSVELNATKSLDIFAFGVTIAYAVLGGKHLFGPPLFRAVNIIQGKVIYMDKVASVIDERHVTIIKEMVKTNPSSRPTISNIIKNAFTD